MGKIKSLVTEAEDSELYQDALERILSSNRLEVAKEIAAEALDLDPDEYLMDDELDDLDYYDEDTMWEENYD